MSYRKRILKWAVLLTALGLMFAGLGSFRTSGFAQAGFSPRGLTPFRSLLSIPGRAAEMPGAEVSIPAAKLTTLLSRLASSVPQQHELVAPATGAPQLSFAAATLPKSVRDALHGRMMRVDSSGNVQVYIETFELTAPELESLESAGAKIEVVSKKLGIVQAHVPVTLLNAISALPFVRFVRLPNYAIFNTGSVDTQGDSILQAAQARSQLNLDGTGVKVGVISDGIKGIFATGCTTCGPTTATPSPINSGDLPTATGTRNSSGVLTAASGGITAQGFATSNDLEDLTAIRSIPGGCAFAGAGAEGTALMEIVYDLAPKVQLFFSNADTDLEFNQAVDYIASNADVGVDDLSFVGLPYDGTSDVSSNTATQLNTDTNPIRAYFTSVGNFAGFHYLGLYTDSGVNGTTVSGITNSGDLHLFQACGPGTSCSGPATTDVLNLGPQPYDFITLPAGPSTNPTAGGEVVIFLTWDDPFGSSSNNYDLYLARADTNTVVDSSTDVQNGSGADPVEFVDYTNTTGAQHDFHILVQNVNNAATPKHLNLYIFQPECAASGPLFLGGVADHNYNTISQSVPAESDAGGGVISVGAEDQTNYPAPNPPPPPTVANIEPYSSNGPTLDGRIKPDVTAVDGVSVTGAGNFVNPFFGTSAAAPHGAGAAALLLQAASCLRSGAAVGSLYTTPAMERAALRNLVLSNALAIGSPVPNNTYGAGLIDILAAALKTVPTANAGANQSVSGGAPVTLDGSGSSDPDTCALTYNWTGNCGTATGATPSVTCPPGTDTETLTVTNNGVTLSAPASVQISVSDFALAASPSSATVTAGSSATYTVTVSNQNGAFTNPISFSCSGLPTGAACSFSPTTVTPGSSSPTTTLTISTTAPSSVPFLPRLPWGRPPFSLVWVAFAFALFALLAGFARRAKPRSLRLYLPLAVLVVLAAWQVACGGSSTPPPPPPPSGVTLSTTSLGFSSQAVGTTSSAQNVTVTSSGGSALTVSGVTASGDFAQTNNCTSSSPIASGSTCSVNVTFTPTASGTRTGSLTLTDNAPSSPQTVSLTGTGVSGTASGTYSVSVTGTSGTLAHSQTVTLVVQ